MEKSRARIMLVLFAVAVLWTALAFSAQAQEQPLEWSVDIAKQLLAEGWEEVPAPGTEPVVGYSLHFLELDREIVRRLGFGFELEKGQDTSLWAVSVDDFQIGVLLDTPFRFTGQLYGQVGQAAHSASHDSWLITTSGEPLRVDISTVRLPTASSTHREERLAVTIVPRRIDGETRRIETEIALVYETLSGSVSQLHTTAWIGAAAERPIAVVTREVDVGRRTEYQYFAVYVAGAVIPDEMIPQDAQLIPMGTIAGMQEVMAEPGDVRPVEIGLGAGYSEGRWGVVLDGYIPIADCLAAYGHVQSVPEMLYAVGVEGGLNEELFLVAELGNGSGDGASVHLGLRDELQYGDGLKLSAAALPIRVSRQEPGVGLVFHWRLRAEVLLGDYSFSYQAQNDTGKVAHQIGVTMFRTKPAQARFSWMWSERHGHVFAAGIWLSF